MTRTFAGFFTASLILAMAVPAGAQQPGAGDAAATTNTAQTRAPKAPARGSDAGAPAQSQSGGDADLRRRVEQLEEQLVDLQVVIGTLESLAKPGASAPASQPTFRPSPGGGYTASDDARMDGVETQIKALTAQMEQLTEQVRALGGQSRIADSVPPPMTPTPTSPPAAPAPGGNGAPASRFGSTTVTPGANDSRADPIGGLITGGSSDASPPQDYAAATPAPTPGEPPAGAADGGNPKQLYETAYGYLLQQDYGAAEAAFDDFLKRYPNDSLAGNAQYWLGESHFVRGEYKAAASAFLKGYQTYAKSSKAPDSLLKLAMSLDRLGQKDAACSSYSELTTKFPTAPPHVKNRAQTERQRIGCS